MKESGFFTSKLLRLYTAVLGLPAKEPITITIYYCKTPSF